MQKTFAPMTRARPAIARSRRPNTRRSRRGLERLLRLGTRSFRSVKLGDTSYSLVGSTHVGRSIGPWILPRDEEKILNFEDAASASGLLEPHLGQDLTGSWVTDRASLRSQASWRRSPADRGLPLSEDG